MKMSVRFGRRLTIWFYGVFGVLFFSGIVWLMVHYFGIEHGNPEREYNSFEPRLLKIHGAAAMASLVILGVLIPLHMRRAWEQRRNRITAVVMVSLCLVMVATGYGLYYCGDDQLRWWISGAHSAAGCLLPIILIWHIFSGREQKQKNI